MPPSDHPHILFLVSSPLTADPVAVDRALQELTDALQSIQALALVLAALQDPQARQLLQGLAAGAVHE